MLAFDYTITKFEDNYISDSMLSVLALETLRFQITEEEGWWLFLRMLWHLQEPRDRGDYY